ncbi:hypothetical protein Q7P35_004375 [Cladosporium inversicolor]
MRLSCVPVPRFSSSIFVLSTPVAVIFIYNPLPAQYCCTLLQFPPVRSGHNHSYTASLPNITIRAADSHPIPSHLPNISQRQRAASPTTTDANTSTFFAATS